MLLPIGDLPHGTPSELSRSRPGAAAHGRGTYGLVAACVLVFAALHLGGTAPGTVGLVPAEALSGKGSLVASLAATLFVHVSGYHLFVNVLHLWVFGVAVERWFGTGPYLALYFGGGLLGTLTHVAFYPESLLPLLGASSAISGVIGAYLALYPRNRLEVAALFFTVPVPAALMVGLWVGFQALTLFTVAAPAGDVGGVAYGAHLGGFAFGTALAVASRWRRAGRRGLAEGGVPSPRAPD